MIISCKRYEQELEKARHEGFREASRERYLEDSFREIYKKIDRLEAMINQHVKIPGNGKDVSPDA